MVTLITGHGKAVDYIAKYLKPSARQRFTVYVDADFSGSWLEEYAMFDPTTTKLRLG